MSHNLVKADNPKLKKVCTEIDLKPGIKYAKQMIGFFKKVDGIGLAAPQMGRTVRVFIIRYKGTTIACINPVITWTSRKKITTKEGCLSHERTRTSLIKVKRYSSIAVAYHNIKGEFVEETYEDEDFRGTIFQHELDHLNGICIIDK